MWQWLKSSRRSAEKELNIQRLAFYPRVQEFMNAIYGKTGGWMEAMQAEGRYKELLEMSNKLILWGSDETLTTWINLVGDGQRGKLHSGRMEYLWAQLDASMRKDLGYGKGLSPEELYPILFSPETVDRIKEVI